MCHDALTYCKVLCGCVAGDVMPAPREQLDFQRPQTWEYYDLINDGQAGTRRLWFRKKYQTIRTHFHEVWNAWILSTRNFIVGWCWQRFLYNKTSSKHGFRILIPFRRVVVGCFGVWVGWWLQPFFSWGEICAGNIHKYLEWKYKLASQFTFLNVKFIEESVWKGSVVKDYDFRN